MATILPSAMANARQANLGSCPSTTACPSVFRHNFCLTNTELTSFESVVIKYSLFHEFPVIIRSAGNGP
jgi:hypothetical protein